MQRLRAWLLAFLIGLSLMPPRPAFAADERQAGGNADCVVRGSPAEFAPGLDEFGTGGDAATKTADPSYWNGRGYLFIHERREKATFRTEPGGGYLAGGVVLASSPAEAQADLQKAAAEWLANWEQPPTFQSAGLGDDSLIATRTTPWEVGPGQNMVEVFVGFQTCNASAHLLLAAAPNLDPIGEARRYAEGVAGRLLARAAEGPLALAPGATSGKSAVLGCSVDGPLERFSLTPGDFGASGGAYAVPGDYGYWQRRGYSFGFARASGDEYEGSPWGGYLFGGFLRAADQWAARSDFRAALNGWTKEWDPQTTKRVEAPPIGDESIILSRFTPWEVNQQQPMVEVFVAFRRCNVSAHFIVTVMPGFDPIGQALRYAHLIDDRMSH